MKKKIRLWICMALFCAVCLSLAACGGGGGYGVKAVEVLVEQEYSLAFRNDDPTAYYVIGAIRELDREGKVDELAAKWFGQRIVSFPEPRFTLDQLPQTEYRDFIIGVDINSIK